MVDMLDYRTTGKEDAESPLFKTHETDRVLDYILLNSAAFREYLHREFPEQASQWNDPKGRRQFLKLMSASLALAGVGACTKQPPEKIIPYVRQPEDLVPGKPLFFATALPFAGVAAPVLVESHEGRPTKVEGNPQHPASLGATDAFAQADVLTLYDPDRAQTVMYRGEVRGWGDFLTASRSVLALQKAKGSAGFFRELLCVLFKALCLLRPKQFEVFQQDAVIGQEVLHALGVGDGQMAFENETGIRSSVPHRNDYVADRRRTVAASPEGLSPGEVAPVGSDHA